MRAQSIQFKFLTTVLAGMLAVAIFVGGLCLYEVDNFVQRETQNILAVTCEKDATQVNDMFGDMEKSVNIMASYVMDFFNSMEEVEDRDRQNLVIEYADNMFIDVAKNTNGAIAYYLRMSHEIADYKTGIFYTKMNGGEEYVKLETTDISLYEKDDIEHVGWYWLPYEAEEPVWIQPYHNKNNDILMISYVVPLYLEGNFIGLVGMDFDYNVLLDKVHEIKIYEHGFARLEMDGVVICDEHHEGEDPAYDSSAEYLSVSEELENGMTLVLSASVDDIRQIRYEIGFKIIYVMIIPLIAFTLIVIFLVGKIVKPLKKLTEASEKLASGDYDVEIVHSDTYEINLLSSAFEKMIMNLREHENLQYLLAYRDSMTGLRNTTSYKVWITDANKEIQEKKAEFGIVAMDINYLKETNDKYGHDVGNKLIIAVAQIISRVFKRSPVFRIGGDEFLAILQNRDLENYNALIEELDSECANCYVEENGVKIPIMVARGFARYEADTDKEFIEVFHRADDEMYKHKRKGKSTREAALVERGK